MAAPGHMFHPFDCPGIETGQDLMDFFNSASSFLKENSASVKIDGVNVSFKLIDGKNGKEFAADRGSLKEIDISGITLGRVEERFPEGHSLRERVRKTLTFLNESLPEIERELKELGMWDDNSIFMNADFVSEGKTNVTEYDNTFLAIHGLNKFYEATHSRNGSHRPGSTKPNGVKSPSHEIEYPKGALNDFVAKVNEIAKKQNINVIGSIPTKTISEICFQSALSSLLEIRITEDDSEKKSLSSWLEEVVNPKNIEIKLKEGKKVKALSRKVFNEIIKNKTPISNLLESGMDVVHAINGAVFWYATKELGSSVLKSLTSDLGEVSRQEGIVLRNDNFNNGFPVKITGDFISKVEDSVFSDQNIVENSTPVKLVNNKKTTIVFPGGFKPPHAGHYDLLKRYVDDRTVNEVVILIGKSSRPKKIEEKKEQVEVGEWQAKQIWEIYLKTLENASKVKIIELSTRQDLSNSVIRAAFEWVEKSCVPGSTYALATSKKDNKARGFNDFKRAIEFETYYNSGNGVRIAEEKGFFAKIHPISTKTIKYKNRSDSLDNTPISSTVMRKDAKSGNLEIFSSNVPKEARAYSKEILEILNTSVLENFTKKKLYSLVKEVIADYGGGVRVSNLGGYVGTSTQALTSPKIHTASEAPNYRISKDKSNCANCKNFNKEANKEFDAEMCKFFNFKTTERYVCDDWQSAKVDEFSGMGVGSVGGSAGIVNITRKKKNKNT